MSTGRASGAELLRRALVNEGTRVMFGHPGGAILPFYDVLHGAPGPRHVLVRHEQAAAHAADGYARASGEVGVCVATSGPGAANLVTGLATALMDGVPLVAITGQVPSTIMGTDAFQETDTLGITMPVTKHGFLVRSPDDIPGIVADAFRIARSGRPGPVVVDVPKDVQFAEADIPEALAAPRVDEARVEELERFSCSWVDGKQTTTGAAVAAALTRLRAAERPVLMVGRGVISSETHELVTELANATNLPVVTTLLGLDAFPTSHPQCLGMPGMHGTERANHAIQEADLIVGLGLRFDDRVTGNVSRFAPGAGIVHFDIDPRAHGRTIRTDVAVLGDLKETLAPFVRGAGTGPRVSESWWERIHAWRRDAADPTDIDLEDAAPNGPITGRQATRALAQAIRRDRAIVTTDVGQHQMWLAQELADADPCTHLTSGGLGTMGYALPAAMGAAIACPHRAVWAVIGDGGFQMTLQELATVVQEGLHLRIAVVNNAGLGMVRQWQTRIHGNRRVASDLGAPDFCALATAYRIQSELVDQAGDLSGALDRAATWPGPVLLDLRILPDDEVYPMVRPGAGLNEMWMTAPGEKVAP